MRDFVKVVKAKRVKSLYARVYARAKKCPRREKRGEKIWMREKGKSARAVGDKNVRPISKNVGEKKKNVGDFPKNVGENLENLRRFLSNLRSLVVMLAGCVMGRTTHRNRAFLPHGTMLFGGTRFSFSFAPPVADSVRPLFAENEQSRIL